MATDKDTTTTRTVKDAGEDVDKGDPWCGDGSCRCRQEGHS